MNNKITIPTLLLAAVTTVGFMLPQSASARDHQADKRGNPPKFVHYDRERHQRQYPLRPIPRWFKDYQQHHPYGYQSWHRHPGYFANKHAWKKHYRRMERERHHYPRHDQRRYGRNYDSNIHFRIDYWD